MTILAGIKNIPKHIIEWIEGNTTASTVEADVLSFIAGSYGIVVSVLKTVGPDDLKALEAAMLTAAETAFAAAAGDILVKLEAAGVAALAAGTALIAGDLAVAFKDVTDAEKANLLHTLATAKATEVSIPATPAA